MISMIVLKRKKNLKKKIKEKEKAKRIKMLLHDYKHVF